MINYNNIDFTIFNKIYSLDWLNRYKWIDCQIFENINIKWKKTYKLLINNQLIFNWIWKNKAIQIINNWLKYLKTENFNFTIDWLFKSMIF